MGFAGSLCLALNHSGQPSQWCLERPWLTCQPSPLFQGERTPEYMAEYTPVYALRDAGTSRHHPAWARSALSMRAARPPFVLVILHLWTVPDYQLLATGRPPARRHPPPPQPGAQSQLLGGQLPVVLTAGVNRQQPEQQVPSALDI